MFYQDGMLQFPVRVEKPDPLFAKMLQQAIGGVEGEMRVAMQYMFQAWGLPAEMARYRSMLLNTAAEEIGHIEMLATAVAKNLEGAPVDLRVHLLQDPGMRAAMAGQLPRHILSSGLRALPEDANGVPFNGNYVVASGNLAADMYANIEAESTGRLLVTRLWEMTDDEGMKEMLAYLIARDTMHQNQWHAVLEELGDHVPVPRSFPQEREPGEFSYAFFDTSADGGAPPAGRWTTGRSIDGKGDFVVRRQPGGGTPDLRAGDVRTHNDVDVFARPGAKGRTSPAR